MGSRATWGCSGFESKASQVKRSDETLVTFLPMDAVADDFSGILARDERPYRDVAKGYTYFEEDDVLFSKITPCLQNGKHTLATGLNGGFGFGTTEFHVVRAGIRVTAQYVFRVLTQAHVIEQCSKSFTGTAGQQRIQSETLNRDFPYWESSGSKGSPNEMVAS